MHFCIAQLLPSSNHSIAGTVLKPNENLVSGVLEILLSELRSLSHEIMTIPCEGKEILLLKTGLA
jgi:hypothetical protein